MRISISRLTGILCPVAALALSPDVVAPQQARAAAAAQLDGNARVQAHLAEAPAGALAIAAMSDAELPDSGRHLLVTGAGLAFHRTEQRVHALRTVLIGDDDAAALASELHLWEEEQPDGSRLAHYAYTRGGTAALGRVRSTNYQIGLAEHQFDPLREAQPRVSQHLVADTDNALHLVQFHATPLPVFQDAIVRAGGKVLRFLTEHTFLVEMDASVRAKVARLPYVRWVFALA